MKSNSKPWLFGPHWQGQKCLAKTRRGTHCQRPARLPVGKCRLHGGVSSGPRTAKGLAKLVTSKTTHGRTSKLERAKARHRAEVGRHVRRELKEIEQWAVDLGHLTKDWREHFK